MWYALARFLLFFLLSIPTPACAPLHDLLADQRNAICFSDWKLFRSSSLDERAQTSSRMLSSEGCNQVGRMRGCGLIKNLLSFIWDHGG